MFSLTAEEIVVGEEAAAKVRVEKKIVILGNVKARVIVQRFLFQNTD